MKKGIDKLGNVLDVLLGEGGCPWDREQTHASLKPHLVEECYEVLDAIDRGSADDLREELGDVLLHVMFHAKLAERDGQFTFDDVANGITNKMIHRHRHIFGTDAAETPEDVLQNWERIKKEEKGFETVTEALRAIPQNFPALMYAQKALKKAVKVDKSFSVESAARCLEDFAQRLRKADQAETVLNMEEIGDFLLRIAYIPTIFQINPEFALTNALKTYINEFEDIERTQKEAE